MMRGEALRYAGWQIWDRTGPRLLGSLVMAAAVSLPLHFAMRNSPPPRDMLSNMVAQMHLQFAFVSMVLLFNGIVAEDRSKGYFRFYLAKPASPLWFYGQSYLLAVAAMPLWSAGFVTIFSLAVSPLWPWHLVPMALAQGLLLGGLVFAFSTALGQRDGMWMIVALTATSLLRAWYPASDSALGRVLHVVLPPTHLLDERLTASQWVWLGSWGIGLFALGLVVLRVRPLGED